MEVQDKLSENIIFLHLRKEKAVCFLFFSQMEKRLLEERAGFLRRRCQEGLGRGRKRAVDQPTHSRGPWCWVVTGNFLGRPWSTGHILSGHLLRWLVVA